MNDLAKTFRPPNPASSSVCPCAPADRCSCQFRQIGSVRLSERTHQHLSGATTGFLQLKQSQTHPVAFATRELLNACATSAFGSAAEQVRRRLRCVHNNGTLTGTCHHISYHVPIMFDCCHAATLTPCVLLCFIQPVGPSGGVCARDDIVTAAGTQKLWVYAKVRPNLKPKWLFEFTLAEPRSEARSAGTAPSYGRVRHHGDRGVSVGRFVC